MKPAAATGPDAAALLQATLDKLPDGVALFDAGGGLLACNAPAAPLLGLPAPVALDEAGRGGRPAAAAADQAAVADILRQAFAADQPLPLRLRRGMADGRVLDIACDRLATGGVIATFCDATAHARAEAEVRGRAATLQHLIDNMRYGVTLFGPDGRVVTSNRLAAGGMGTEHIRPGMTLPETIHRLTEMGVTGDAALDREFSALALSLDRSRPHRYTRPTRDGRILEVTSDPLPDGGYLISHADVTPLARAEAAAKQRADLLQSMLDNCRHGMVLYGADRRIIALNALAVRISGLTEAEMAPGRSLADVLAAQKARGLFGSGAEAEATMAEIWQADRSLPRRKQRTERDGRVVEITSDPAPDGGFVVTYIDVTARARAEQAAQERSALLRLSLDSMRHGIAMFGADRRLLVANDLFATLAGLDPAALRAGCRLDDLLPRHGGAEAAAHCLARAKADGHCEAARYQHRMADGTVREVISDPTPGGGCVITVTDITSLARAEEEARQRATLLQVTLDNMRHGIALFGPDHRLLSASRLAGPELGLPPLQQRIGITLEALVAEQVADGIFGSDPESVAETVRFILTLDRSVPYCYHRRRTDGQVIEIACDPTPDGGFVISYSNVTALVQAQAEAQQRAAMLQVMLENMQHGIALFDHEGRLLTANRLAAHFNGMDLESATAGRSLADLLREMVAQDRLPPEVAAAQLGLDRSRPHRTVLHSSNGLILDVRSNPTPDGGFVVTYGDVTELARAQAEVLHRAETLQLILESTRHGIALFGPDRRLVSMNALAARLHGFADPSAQIGRSLEELLRDAAAHGHLSPAEAEADLAQDHARPWRGTRAGPDGSILEVICDPTPQGGFVLTYTDVTLLVAVQKEAERRANIMQVMLDNMRHGIALFDSEGTVVAANALAARMCGLTAEEMRPGVNIQALRRLQIERGEYGSGPMAEETIRARISRPWHSPDRYVRMRQDGSVREVTTDRTPDGGYVRVYSDVTEERRIRAELQQAKDAAEAANLAKSRFLATMSHELRTPLNAVIGFSEAIMANPDPQAVRDYIRPVHDAGRHLLSLIDDILDVARAETVGFQIAETEVDLGDLAEGSVRVMQKAAEASQVTLTAQLPQRLPHVLADELRLRQVLLNLLSNAVKFTPAGGKVTLDARLLDSGDLVLRVTDTGIGIKPEDIPRAFEPFTQLDSSLARRFPGSGLGLYLSKALAEAQGAQLALQSDGDFGTTAVLRFPRHRLLVPQPG